MRNKRNSVKRGMAVCICVAVLCAACLYVYGSGAVPWRLHRPDDSIVFRTMGQEIQLLQNEAWTPFHMKGVNIGTGYPGVFPNEYGITDETYSRWFDLIGEMNANTIRVYKIQSPAFYAALSRYNQTHDRKLYLVQGVDFRENLMYTADNFLEGKQKEAVFRETYDVVDALHGRNTVLVKETGDLLCYTADVSDYVIGYILGIEWDEIFVSFLCELNAGIPVYNGEYLSSREDANPFEIFLAEWGDRTLGYEEKKYGTQKLISFCNWPDTDPFENELDLNNVEIYGQEKNTEALIDLEKILPTERIKGGLFASYNVYPYFPRFLQFGPYTEYVDDTGRVNPYRGYLQELVKHHSYPVVISEFGVPSSRSVAYEDFYRGLSHGGLSETEQGQAMLTLYEDTQKAGCAGAIVFSWQDEWYKKTWNEKVISEPERRPFWNNAQSAEQGYGLLAFDPGTEEEANYPDGQLSEWSEDDVVMESGRTTLSMKSDERYVYFLAEGLDQRQGHDRIQIALDITPKSGAMACNGTDFPMPADVIIQLDQRNNGAVYIQDYYDPVIYSMAESYPQISMDEIHTYAEKLNVDLSASPRSQTFGMVKRAGGNIFDYLRKKLVLEQAGLLKHGNANPASPDYDSNADFFLTEDAVEIRIPWQLLNFYDPSQCMIVDDYRKNDFQIKGLKIDAIYAAAYFDDQPNVTDFGKYELSGWEKPRFHERLKESYYVMQEAFGRD